MNTFTGGGGVGGYNQNPTAQASPFARRPVQSNGSVSAGGSAVGAASAAATGWSYGRVSPPADGRQDASATMGFGGEVALVPVDANGSSHGRSVMYEDDDDEMPTRSLADSHDVHDDGVGGRGLRQRRGGDGRTSGIVNEEPDAQRATWVVVWGVPPGKANDVLTCFLQFGHIEEQRGKHDSNWLYFK